MRENTTPAPGTACQSVDAFSIVKYTNAMNTISEVTVGESVYVISSQEKGPVVEVRASSIIVRLMTGRVEVLLGDFERR